MATTKYQLSYKQSEDIVFPSEKGMSRYLREESAVWKEFLEALVAPLNTILVGRRGEQITPANLVDCFDDLATLVKDNDKFSQLNRLSGRKILIPPPSNNLEGQLILGLYEAEMNADALAVYIFFLTQNFDFPPNRNQTYNSLIARGKLLWEVVPVVVALPHSKTSSSKLAAAVRSANNHVSSLSDQVIEAQELNAKQKNLFQAQLDEARERADRLGNVIAKLNKRRERKHKLWVKGVDLLISKYDERARGKIYQIEKLAEQTESKRVEEFERLQDLFRAQLRIRAPVELWQTRETLHSKSSKRSMGWFLGVSVFAIAIGVLVPLQFGDYIAGSFLQEFCAVKGVPETASNAAIPASVCEQRFSAKGPLTVAGMLLVMSLLMWMARLQYRVFLSERHLALDASEKKAFAETFLAMQEGKGVSAENEAIVLGSLFRPTQDGIIKDDEPAMDLSAAAVLAKSLSRNS